MKKYLVAVTFCHSYTVYYFKELYGPAGASTFFKDYCGQMGIKTENLLPRHTWAREQKPGITIDFEKIQETVIESIFELQ